MIPRSRFILVTIIVMMTCTVALACRYTVRDIGFVRLSEPRVRLYLIDSDHTEAVIDRMRSELPVEIIRIASDHDPGHPAVSMAREEDVGAILIDDTDRILPVADPLVIGQTRLARTLAEDSASTFAWVLLLEGPDAADNAAAAAEIGALEDGLRAIEEHLPRPLGHPLRTITIPIEDQARDATLLWSLGVDLPVTETTALITYGRARRAGEVVRFTPETRTAASRELLSQLALVGESCECDTTRAWTEEPVGLVPWTRSTHSNASSSLGFDAESPMVRAEVSRILFRGGTSPGAEESRPDSLEELLLGYGETTLEPVAPAPGPDVSSTGPLSATDGPAPPITVSTATEGDDWSFTETPATKEQPDSEAADDQTAETDPEESAPGVRNWTPVYSIGGMVLISFALAFFVVRRMEGR